jgi:hypothetical protein
MGAALVLVSVFAGVAAPARAVPPASTDPEGGSASVSAALAQASQGWSAANAKLAASRQRQAELTAEMAAGEKRVAELSRMAGQLGAEAYRGGHTSQLVALLNSDSARTMLGRASFLQHMSHANDTKLSGLKRARADLEAQKRKLDAEVAVAQAAVTTMASRKSDAERALAQSGGGQPGTDVGGAASRSARSVPRNADGSLASQGCVLPDPTTSGCLTARTLNALQQARAAGFTRYTACHRAASFGEHGKGRACDFSVSVSGFGGTASGADKAYGNRLSAWFIANADRLGVMYVIWFHQIWMPSTGWRSYSGGGSPSASHTNHVHLSVL